MAVQGLPAQVRTDHQHIDACRVCNGETVAPGRLSGAWRSFVAFVGMGPATGVGSQADERPSGGSCDIANDARLTRALIERRLPSVRRHLDRVPPTPQPAHLALVPERPRHPVVPPAGGEQSGPAAASA